MIAYSLISILLSTNSAYSETKLHESIPSFENTSGISIYTRGSTTILLGRTGGGSIIFGSGNHGNFSFDSGTLSFQEIYEIAKAGKPASPGSNPLVSLYFGTAGARKLDPFEVSDPSVLLPFVAAAITGIRKHLANQSSTLTQFEKSLSTDHFLRNAHQSPGPE